MTFPRDPWDSLSQEHRDIFWSIPGSDYLEPGYETNYAETLYAVGFGYTAEEYESMGLDPDTVTNARRDYFDHMGLVWEDFPWDDWRAAMGYEEAA